MAQIPIIDISPSRPSAPSGQQALDAVVDELRRACTEVGFLQITGHGVPLELMAAVYDTVTAVAGLDAEQKKALLSPTGHQFRGLVGGWDDDGNVLVESLQVNVYDNAAGALAAGVDAIYAPYFHPNVWPSLDGLREAWLACSEATRGLGQTLMGLFARALDLPESYFQPDFEMDVTQFGINWYPPQPPVEYPRERILTRAHADSGVLTILHQQGSYEGLQVLSRDGEWIDVPVVPEAFVINIGNLMHRWTNGVWPATVHRVVASGDPEASRASIVTFYLPAVDTVIAPLPTMVGPSGPVFEPVMQYDWEGQYMKSEGLAPGGRSRLPQVQAANAG